LAQPEAALRRVHRNRIEPRTGLRNARPSQLLSHFAVPYEDEVWPEFDPVRQSEGSSFAILDFDVSNLRVLVEENRQLRLQCPAVTSPIRAEFEKNRPWYLIDFLPGRLRRVVAACHFCCHIFLPPYLTLSFGRHIFY